jgi:hypothetical protein
LFTIALQPKLLEDYQEAFVYNAQIPMVRSYHSSINLYTKLAQEIGFTFEELLEPKHPSQTAFIATFTGAVNRL